LSVHIFFYLKAPLSKHEEFFKILKLSKRFYLVGVSEGFDDALPKAYNLARHRLVVSLLNEFYEVSSATATCSQAFELLIHSPKDGVMGWHNLVLE